MKVRPRVLAVIPARRGSKGLPGKNIKPFMGIPLIAHSIMLAKMCPQINRCIVSTDSHEIADVATKYSGDVPFIRPQELAQDNTPMLPVLRHALKMVEIDEAQHFDYLVLLDPTSPGRYPQDVTQALQKLMDNSNADGIIGVSEPDFSPLWHCVVDNGGWMEDLSPEAVKYERRQDVPKVYRINGSIYIWRSEYIRTSADSWRSTGKHVMMEIPESRAMSFDTEEEFIRTETLVRSGLIKFPWLLDDVE